MVLAALVASMAVMTALTHFTGFTRVLSLGHIWWVPMLYWLWGRLDQIPAEDVFGVWIRIVVTL